MVVLVELAPFLLTIWLTAAKSVALSVTVKLVPLVISTLVVVKVYELLPSPTRASLDTVMSLVAPLSLRKPVPVTSKAPVAAL